ncbi:MAG: M20/M25/M40 family metallo-hydrolase [Acidobacteria bacterium]|nr:M20/M25/M40 family metallo-hydrolase [Acidobacteriota bacterium]
MKRYRCLVRLIVLALCLGLTAPIIDTYQIAFAQSKKKKPLRRTTRRRTARKKAVTPKKPSFDKVMSENKGLPGEAGDIDQAANRIDENTLRAHIKFLADDMLEGRGPGSRGGQLAARYIAAQFEALGLEPATADRTYFQQVQMIGSRTDPSSRLTIKTNGGDAEFRFGDEFVGGTDLEQTEIPVSGDVVFVGYGISAPELKWDDYKGQDVRGKVVMMMVNEPPATAAEPELFAGKALTYYGRWTYKYEEAARRGAAGVILIHTNETAGYGWSVVRNSWGGERFGLLPEGKTPTLQLKSWVTDETARKIAQMGGQNLDQLRQAASTRAFRPVAINAKVNMTLRTQVQRLISPNVAGILRGIDPALKNEFVIYSGHWDHLGIRPDQPGDNIYNGATDNATGISGMIAIARAFQALNLKPKRSILFIATTAEEQGLLGAEYYVRNPLVPLAKTQANINIDSMNTLGLTTDITPLGAERSTLGPIIEAVAKENNLTISGDAHPEQGYFYRSDHFPFAKAGVPAVNFEPGSKFVGHSEKWIEEKTQDYREHRYHQPTDEYRPNWDFSGMVQQARLGFLIGLRIANTDEPQKWKKGDEFEAARLKTVAELK